MQKQKQKAVKNAKRLWMSGYIYDFVYLVVMSDVVILRKISMPLNTLEALNIPKSSRLSLMRIGNGAMLTRRLRSNSRLGEFMLFKLRTIIISIYCLP